MLLSLSTQVRTTATASLRGRMDIPESLDGWTYDTVVAVVERHEYEPARFDYKMVLNPTLAEGRDAQLASVRHTTCSMANASGGGHLFAARGPQKCGGPPQQPRVGPSL